MQLYVDRQRAKSEALLRRVEGLGLKAVFVTVDAAAPGKREADERGRAEIEVVRLVVPGPQLSSRPAPVIGYLGREDPVGRQGWRYWSICGRIYRPQIELERYYVASKAYGSADWAQGYPDGGGKSRVAFSDGPLMVRRMRNGRTIWDAKRSIYRIMEDGR
jgi:L-lactate dehydrogenase (cytochrome)